ncbi:MULTISPECIES: very short patch repair endonuclease [unclassified Symbiopectobacterium]|uniref:very short patch repair endonuclease n=1 Tax=unclassified Symbiopectobacterium TaxID=2794573 RepID=UPI00222758EE|nr:MULTISPECIES: DNA mismatch endonuclease Vsr [unclassified Symbiopectobacterium]MCW2474469.1 DNA mismatch endonuclease Vsr [Candidatus Symbiopectobacterium sp. NZEC151]MCW2482899.1 DNA mismatch endonuclease Vsr [Candidatus Symbiopectobacterium sp. NZEC135]
MADVHDKLTRRKNMQAIRNCDTAIEKKISRILDELEVDYSPQVKELPGRPDFVIEQYRAVIFVHGCFWHGHQCDLFKIPKTRTEFWLKKIGDNVHRDRLVIHKLIATGWKVLLIWECALKGRSKASQTEVSERIEEWLCASDVSAEINTKGINKI